MVGSIFLKLELNLFVTIIYSTVYPPINLMTLLLLYMRHHPSNPLNSINQLIKLNTMGKISNDILFVFFLNVARDQ